ncbi:MAG: hypothetical protein CML45_06175 [Rhodobacteraceae bacterium]|jgi:hypothetical protein|nr:hypothetical protein [Paracoccaceae bacterium]
MINYKNNLAKSQNADEAYMVILETIYFRFTEISISLLISIALFYVITIALDRQNAHIESFNLSETYIIDEN